MMKKIIYLLLFVFFCGHLLAQEAPFASDIRAFKTADSLKHPPAGKILFIGSSSFTMWRDVNDYFPGYGILNRAFGGSTLLDLIHYRYEVIYPYQPKQIVMYCGENDFASSDTVTVEMTISRFKKLFGLIRAKYPSVPFVYVSMKPSPSRRHLMSKYEAANKQIAKYLKGFRHTVFADVFSKMIDKNGEPFDDIFLEDKLHMNAKGYAIWKKILQPLLKK